MKTALSTLTPAGMHPRDGGKEWRAKRAESFLSLPSSPGLQPSNTLEAGKYMVKNETRYFLLQAMTFHDVAGNHGAL